MPFTNSWMQPEIYAGSYYAVETTGGTWIVPTGVLGFEPALEDFKDFCDGAELISFNLERGWLARMSAPGYMDCTDWSAHKTVEEALQYLEEGYGEDPA